MRGGRRTKKQYMPAVIPGDDVLLMAREDLPEDEPPADLDTNTYCYMPDENGDPVLAKIIAIDGTVTMLRPDLYELAKAKKREEVSDTVGKYDWDRLDPKIDALLAEGKTQAEISKAVGVDSKALWWHLKHTGRLEKDNQGSERVKKAAAKETAATDEAVEVQKAQVTNWAELWPRAQELLSKGLSRDEVAAQLGVSRVRLDAKIKRERRKTDGVKTTDSLIPLLEAIANQVKDLTLLVKELKTELEDTTSRIESLEIATVEDSRDWDKFMQVLDRLLPFVVGRQAREECR